MSLFLVIIFSLWLASAISSVDDSDTDKNYLPKIQHSNNVENDEFDFSTNIQHDNYEDIDDFLQSTTGMYNNKL